MIEYFNAEKNRIERIEDGAPSFQIPVYFNGAPNGDMVEAVVLTRNYGIMRDTVVMPKAGPHTIYPGTVGWMYDGRKMVVEGKSLWVFDRCETMDTYNRLSM